MRELYGYTISCMGLCDDGRMAEWREVVRADWLDKWAYIAAEFTHVQRSLLVHHPDLDVSKLRWEVEGVWWEPRGPKRSFTPPKFTGELTSAELARLP